MKFRKSLFHNFFLLILLLISSCDFWGSSCSSSSQNPSGNPSPFSPSYSENPFPPSRDPLPRQEPSPPLRAPDSPPPPQPKCTTPLIPTVEGQEDDSDRRGRDFEVWTAWKMRYEQWRKNEWPGSKNARCLKAASEEVIQQALRAQAGLFFIAQLRKAQEFLEKYHYGYKLSEYLSWERHINLRPLVALRYPQDGALRRWLDGYDLAKKKVGHDREFTRTCRIFNPGEKQHVFQVYHRELLKSMETFLSVQFLLSQEQRVECSAHRVFETLEQRRAEMNEMSLPLEAERESRRDHKVSWDLIDPDWEKHRPQELENQKALLGVLEEIQAFMDRIEIRSPQEPKKESTFEYPVWVCDRRSQEEVDRIIQEGKHPEPELARAIETPRVIRWKLQAAQRCLDRRKKEARPDILWPLWKTWNFLNDFYKLRLVETLAQFQRANNNNPFSTYHWERVIGWDPRLPDHPACLLGWRPRFLDLVEGQVGFHCPDLEALQELCGDGMRRTARKLLLQKPKVLREKIQKGKEDYLEKLATNSQTASFSDFEGLRYLLHQGEILLKEEELSLSLEEKAYLSFMREFYFEATFPKNYPPLWIREYGSAWLQDLTLSQLHVQWKYLDFEEPFEEEVSAHLIQETHRKFWTEICREQRPPDRSRGALRWQKIQEGYRDFQDPEACTFSGVQPYLTYQQELLQEVFQAVQPAEGVSVYDESLLREVISEQIRILEKPSWYSRKRFTL